MGAAILLAKFCFGVIAQLPYNSGDKGSLQGLAYDFLEGFVGALISP